MGRGRSALGGPSLGNSGGGAVNIIEETDIWSYRHNQQNEPMFEAMISSVRTVDEDFPGLMTDTVPHVDAAVLGGEDREHTLGYYNVGTKNVALNANYTNIDKMNRVYDASAGFHPGRGDKTGTEAVTFHELGHAITGHIADKMGEANYDKAAREIVNRAFRSVKATGGTEAWAGKISGYAKDSNAECIAEAVSDFYCNGSRAAAPSKAIVDTLKAMNRRYS